MLIKLIAFSDFGRAGEIIDVPPDDALRLIRSDQAVSVSITESPKVTNREHKAQAKVVKRG